MAVDTRKEAVEAFIQSTLKDHVLSEGMPRTSVDTQDAYAVVELLRSFLEKVEALEARIAKADALADWVEGIIEDGCPKCGGDCSAANPPVAYCPQREAMNDLAAYRATKEGGA